jgi:hypothetical protein
MTLFPKIVGGVSSGFALCLSLSNVTHAASDPCVDKTASPSSIASVGKRNGRASRRSRAKCYAWKGTTTWSRSFTGKKCG